MESLYRLFLLISVVSLGCHFAIGSEQVFQGHLTPAKQLLFFFVFGCATNLYCNYKFRSFIGKKSQKEVFNSITLFIASALSLYAFVETFYYFIIHRLEGIEGYLVLPFLFFCVSSVIYIRGIIIWLSSVFIRKTTPLTNEDFSKIVEEKRKKQYTLVSTFGISPEQECIMCFQFDKGMCNKILGEMVSSPEIGYKNWKMQKKFITEGVSPEFIDLQDIDYHVSAQISIMTLFIIFRTSENTFLNLDKKKYYKALFLVVASYCKDNEGIILSSFRNTNMPSADRFTFDLLSYKDQLEEIRLGMIQTRGNYGIDDKMINQTISFIQDFFNLDEEEQKKILEICFSKIMNNEENKQVLIPKI